MQQVVVPQFLDVEDKIIGSVTVRQFLELLIGGLIEVVMYKTLDFPAFVVFGLLLLMVTVVVAFAKINGQSFHLFMLNFIQTLRNPKLKVWRKNHDKEEFGEVSAPKKTEVVMRVKNQVTRSRISEMALIVDTGGIYRGENGN